METTQFDRSNLDIAWCPGCGNFKILDTLKLALSELQIKPENLVVVSGIGQAPKTPQYFKTNMFNGLHGRSLPVAAGVKAANPSLTVIAEGGDGDMYGEGGNHFLHCIRRNPNILHVVHNNMVYGLTKGQASPTSQTGFKTPVQVDGVVSEPVNPVAVAIAQNVSFVARAFAGDTEQTKEILKQGIQHHGYALVDILQPCVTFNKINTFKWFKENTSYLDENYDPSDRTRAFEKAIQIDPIPLGILYHKERPVFEESMAAYTKSEIPLYQRQVNVEMLEKLFEKKQVSF